LGAKKRPIQLRTGLVIFCGSPGQTRTADQVVNRQDL
jgi:hypothetical protein